MKVRAVANLLVAALLLQAAAAYECPANCDSEPNCHAASWNIPGGLAPADTPQFIVLTNDDAVTVVTSPVILNITERHTNANGCKMPATWFVSQNFTDCSMVQKMYERGDEIASHTITHPANPNATEIVGQRLWLNQTCGIPLEDVVGFRAPYLLFTPEQRQILYENGFLYDSSISENFNAKNANSPAANEILWPYTFDCGVAQDCTISTGTCDSSERWPGLWEFPLYQSQAADGTVIGGMDPQGNMTDIFVREFDRRYNGNRAPVGIFIHAAWLIAEPEHSGQINAFIDYAMSHDNVYLATITQVIDWIKDPVKASQYSHPCNDQSPTECLMPEGGCGSGAFNPQACKCDCLNENINAGGFCRDASGSCTVQKDFDFVAKTYFCPADASSTPSAGASPTPVPQGTTAAGPAQCGHDLVSFMGTTLSSPDGSSASYAQALRALDGDCNTCAFAQTLQGQPSTFDLSLPQAGNFTGIQLLLGAAANVTVSVGTGSARTVCAQDVAVPMNMKTTVPCNLTGDSFTISYPGNMSLCDVYPQVTFPTPAPAPAAPATGSGTSDPTTGTGSGTGTAGSGTTTGGSTGSGEAAGSPDSGVTVPVTTQVPVTVALDINNMTPDQFRSVQAALCGAIVGMTGDMSATCTVQSVTANNRRRRSLQQTGESVHVVLNVVTSNPDAVAKNLSNGTTLANILSPLGFSVNPSTVQATVQGTATPTTGSQPSSNTTAPTTSAPAPSSDTSSTSTDGGSSTNVGAIVGGVVGGVVGLALIAGGVFYWKRRRSANAAGRVDSVSNPVYPVNPDATATGRPPAGQHRIAAGGSTAKPGHLYGRQSNFWAHAASDSYGRSSDSHNIVITIL
ncbi:hypothetical protein N2152v2_000502 [Parachlorella kessleri]